ncbi:MAG: hypothetical protein Q4D23_11915, partial [Bacteroidales bacterium]|nr:hypothetical protein [Bacteroidales bacterium]
RTIMFVYPFTTVDLNQSYTVAKGHRFGQNIQNMDMIRCSSNTNGRATIVIENLSNVCMHLGKM